MSVFVGIHPGRLSAELKPQATKTPFWQHVTTYHDEPEGRSRWCGTDCKCVNNKEPLCQIHLQFICSRPVYASRGLYAATSTSL